jgi:hypothetical protein
VNQHDQPGGVDAFGRKIPAADPAAPRPLQVARWLWIASTGTGLARSFVQLGDRETLIRELHREAPELSQDQLDSAASSGILFTLLLSFVVFGLYVMLANRMIQGRQWARVVMTVLASISVVGTLFTLIGIAAVGPETITRITGVRVDMLDVAFSAVLVVLDSAALALLYQPASNRFFRDARRVASAGHAGQ